MTLLSYRRISLVTPAYIVMLARVILRIYNFENAEGSYVIEISSQVICLFMLLGFKAYFQSSSRNILISRLMIMFWAVGQTIFINLFKFDSVLDGFLTLLRIFIMCLMIGGLLRLQQGIANDLIKQTKVSYEM
jgi:hypothetical protein